MITSNRHNARAHRLVISAGRGLLAALGCCTALALLVSPARAATVHVFSSSFASEGSGAGRVSSPQGVAVNDATGDVYVADTGNARVDEFDSSGSFVRAWGWGVADGASSFETCTTTCEAGVSGAGAGQFTTPVFIAVDNSSSASAGDVYVGDTGTNLVQKFGASGSLITAWGTGGQLDGSTATGGPFTSIAGITVDTSGKLSVYDPSSEDWFEFAQDSSAQPTTSVGRGTDNVGIGVDSGGNRYKVDGNGNVEQFDSFGNDLGPVDGGNDDTGFAIDPRTGDIYVDEGGSAIQSYDVSCVPSGGSNGRPCTAADAFGSGDLSNATGVAVDTANNNVYAADAGAGDVAVFTTTTVPDVTTTTRSATNIAQASATLTGTVNPDGIQVSACEFEYVAAAGYNPSAGDPYGAGQTVPCTPSDVGAGSGEVSVSANITRLSESTIYHYRLVAANANGSNDSGDQYFVTSGPGFGISSFDLSANNQDGSVDTEAGSHPYALTTSFSFNETIDAGGTTVPDGQLKDAEVDLPPGLIGDPTGIPQCSEGDLVNTQTSETLCPGASQVGVITVTEPFGRFPFPVYNLVPPTGMPAQLGFADSGVPVHIDFSVRTGGDYGVSTSLRGIPQTFQIIGQSLTLWGVPADPSHDAQRVCPGDVSPCSAASPEAPFLTLPTSCTGPLTTTIAADSWQAPGDYKSASSTTTDSNGTPVGLDGCNNLDFSPTLTVQPDTTLADAPAGVDVILQVPQNENPNGLAEADLKNATVTLPAGVSLNPSSANGLAACTPTQIGLDNASQPSCPNASQIGSVQITTPLLPDTMTGNVYVAQQTNNPFGSLLAIYVTAQADGVLIKLVGDVHANPVTGQLTTTFSNNPQLPFSDFKLGFYGGPLAALATPDQCGTYATTSDLTPWSSPGSGPDTTPSGSFTIDSGCVSGFSPSFTAGTQNPQAGAYSPFVLSFSRSDTDQDLSGLSVTLPPGMLAKLAGVAECSDAQLAAAAASSGAAEQAGPSCPAASQVGTVTTGAGPGSDSFFLPGRAYLTGPYKGAPYGLAVIVPALAGPYDLGTVVVRQALYVDPTTAQVTDVSDPFPTILDGIPLRIRRIDVDLNRPDFTINPTSCDPMSVTGALTSTTGLAAPVSSRFQVGGCQALGFSPKLKMALTGKGKTKSGDHPSLVSTLTQRLGQANIHSVKVTLPLSMALDPNNSQHVCNYDVALSVHGGAVGCPPSTIVGTATADTPLLSQPLMGDVYLVQGIRFNKQSERIRTLPSLLIPLRGQIALDLRANTSVNGRSALVTTFSTIPDAPISKFTLTITGGTKGLLVITGRGRNICKSTQVGDATFGAQSGNTRNRSITVKTPCAMPTKRRAHQRKHTTRPPRHGASITTTQRFPQAAGS